MASRHHQTEDDIKAFKGLEAVRKRPSMYIGQGGSHGIFTILREAMDNSVDEFLANSANDDMTVQVFDSGYLAVHDNGQGIPVGKHKTEKISTLQVAVGMLHAGGKLHANAYKHSRGTHGVGVAVTNALSSHFLVFTCRDGVWWRVEYEKGKITTSATKTSAKAIRKHIDPVYKQGTIIMFRPDKDIFGKKAALNMDLVRKWAKTTAYLSGGFSVTVQSNDVNETYLYERGILDWLAASLEELDCSVITDPPIQIKTQHLDACVTFTDAQGGNYLKGYCNGLEQADGGDHVSVTMSALYASLKNVANTKDSFTRDDVAEGLLGIVNFQIDQPQFSSQTKEKLTDPRFAQLCKDDITKEFNAYWNKHKTMATEICHRASLMRSAKVDFLSQKKALTSLKKNKTNLLKMPGKLVVAPDCENHERELFLVEGDSAGGTASRARMAKPYRYQETLFLRGKVPNAYKMPPEKVLANEEVINILTAIGYEPTAKDPMRSLRVGKVVVLSDPDPDGYHIDSLLLALLTTFVPGLFEKELVYKSRSPKYMLTVGKKQFFGMSVEEVREKANSRGKATYLKGWGEANDDAMRIIAFDPKTRHLVLAEPPTEQDLREISLLMGEDTAYRKKLLGV